MRSSWCPGSEPDPERGLRMAIKLLRNDQWPIARIADYLGCELSVVRRVLDPRAEALHKAWKR